jgi:hypothetical protein
LIGVIRSSALRRTSELVLFSTDGSKPPFVGGRVFLDPPAGFEPPLLRLRRVSP